MLFISKIVLAYIYIPNFSPEIGTFQSILLHAKTGILASLDEILRYLLHNVFTIMSHGLLVIYNFFACITEGNFLFSLYIYSWKNKNSKIC